MRHEVSPREERSIRKRALGVVKMLGTMYPEAEVFLEHGSAWELLVAVMLSAQSTDRQVNLVTKGLFARYRTIEEYAGADQDELERLLYSSGFYRAKARNVKRAAQMVIERFGGEVPRTMEELVQLPGVARKTANIVLQSAFDVVVGIPVDTHVLRFAKRYGFSDEADPVKVERDLMSFFPESSWKRLSYQLVSYGREHCPARAHQHSSCPLVAYAAS